MVQIRDWNPTHDDMPKVGEYLGRGAYRSVYKFGRDKVVKYERGGAYANIREWEVWCKAKGTECERYLCPILARSASGDALIQPKVKVLDRVRQRLSNRYYKARTDEQYREALDAMHDFDSKVDDFARTVEEDFEKIGVEAGDLHHGNIGFDKDGNLIVLDYGNFWPRLAQ